jgi:hypothetical protein
MEMEQTMQQMTELLLARMNVSMKEQIQEMREEEKADRVHDANEGRKEYRPRGSQKDDGRNERQLDTNQAKATKQQEILAQISAIMDKNLNEM